MSSNGLTTYFERIEIFQGLEQRQLNEIARHAERMIFKPGQHLIDKGKAGDSAILVVTGQAVRTAGPGADPEAPAEVEPGSLVGEMAMLIETDYTSTIVARTEVRALRVNRQDLLSQMHDDPALAEHFVAKIAARLQQIAGELRRIDQVLAAVEPLNPPPNAAAPAMPAASHEHAIGA